MKSFPLKNDQRALIEHCSVATSFFARFLGLMGRKGLPENQGILFPKCNSIHTFFMRFAIDVVFLDRDGRVIRVIEAMRPWRMLLPIRGAKHALELTAHRARALGIEVGTRLHCGEVLP